MTKAILEVDERSFEEQVLKRSRQVPVVVDFWAPWCGPCRVLGPVLEELATAAKGSWILAKVNSDESPALARAYGIRGIPAVKAFVNGAVVDEFTGALPKPTVESFLRRLIPSESDRLAQEATAASARGDREQEKERWDRLLEEEPGHARALLGRARLALAAGDFEAARRDLLDVPPHSELRADAENLLLLADGAGRVEEHGGLDPARARAAGNPDDVAARYDLGCALAGAGDFEAALTELLEVVRSDRAFGDDAGRRAMLALFSLLGDAHELTREYRGRLGAVLF